eukprot:2524232-Rhodomonas_salina.1
MPGWPLAWSSSAWSTPIPAGQAEIAGPRVEFRSMVESFICICEAFDAGVAVMYHNEARGVMTRVCWQVPVSAGAVE